MDAKDPNVRFTQLLIQHEPALLRYVLVAVPNRADARDILQDCVLALWQSFSDYDSARPFVGWALGFVRIEIRRFLRKSQRRAQLTERAAALLLEDGHQMATDLDERDRYLKHCLDELGGEKRSLIDAYYRQERSVDELSNWFGRSAAAIYKMLQRIRVNLHQCIENRVRRAEV